VALSAGVMGVINVTPDSFFPDSRAATAAAAVARGRAFFAAGGDLGDVGGESPRPGASPVRASDEVARVRAVIEELARVGPVSVDTQKESVARAAVDAGATVINDVSGTLVELAGDLGVGYVAMHRRGARIAPDERPVYDDVVGEVREYLRVAAERARAAAVDPLWLDPGIGFNKGVAHNVALLGHCATLAELAREYGAGLLIGTSRKRFLAHLGREVLDVDQRLEGSIATAAWALVNGATMVRVHDVPTAVQLRDLLARPLDEVAS
jgi:dihydropteroate synthase